MAESGGQAGYGRQPDSLQGMKRFGGLDGIVAYPHWLMELRNRLKFEGGNIVNAIIDGSFSLDSVQRGERVERAQELINSLIVVNRSSVVYRRAWIEEANKEGETVEVITPDGELNMTAAWKFDIRTAFLLALADGKYYCFYPALFRLAEMSEGELQECRRISKRL